MVARMLNLPEKYSFFLFGPRQTGKSTSITEKYRNIPFWEINLLHTDILLKYLKTPYIFRDEAIFKIEKENIKTIFIDEIQKQPLLLNEIQALLFQYPDVQFILTGSSARKLKRGAANLLAGRLVERFLHPFIYFEIQDDFDISETLLYGSLPSLYKKDNSLKKDILNSYINTYLREEIQAEGFVRNLGSFSGFLDIAASQNGELVNYSSISRECRLPVHTVQSYYEILTGTLVALRLDAWKRSVRKRLTTHPKYYMFDMGVTNAICRRLDSAPDSVLHGRLFEQWVILETYRLLSYQRSSLRMYYWRTGAGAEVDLVFERNNTLIAGIEIKTGKQITSVHTKGLRSLREEYEGIPLFIVGEISEPFFIGEIEVDPWKIFLTKINKGYFENL